MIYMQFQIIMEVWLSVTTQHIVRINLMESGMTLMTQWLVNLTKMKLSHLRHMFCITREEISQQILIKLTTKQLEFIQMMWQSQLRRRKKEQMKIKI